MSTNPQPKIIDDAAAAAAAADDDDDDDAAVNKIKNQTKLFEPAKILKLYKRSSCCR